MKQSLASPFAVGVASRVGGQICAFVLILIASRSLGLAEFGAYAIASAVSVIFITLVYTGIYHILLRSEDIERDRDTFFLLQFGVGLVGTSIMAGGAFVFGDLGERGTAFALLALSPIPTLACVSAWLESLLVRDGRVRTTSICVLLSELLGLGTAIWLFRQGHGIEALIASRFASMAFIITVYAGLVRQMPRLRLRRATARHSVREAWPLWGSVSLAMLSNYGADLILGAFLNTAAVGAYRAGSRIANTAADVVIQPLGVISWARFARLETKGAPDLIREAWKENMALGFALVAPAMISLCFLAPGLVSILLDPSWAAASGVVTILAMARATAAVTFLLEPTLTCLGRVRLQFFIRLGDATLLIALLLTIGRTSAESAAVAILVKDLLLMAVALTAMMRVARLDFSDLLEATAPGFGLTLACLAILLGASVFPSAHTPSLAFALTVAALVVTWLLSVTVLLRRQVLVLPRP
ncbi:oligosaccharide flippase family protein [Histidinibacterium aquaticum]|uniref:Oligosaccharide flippase family protein n=1 Tax=Histidinibacterium aquaticum TaxID=2613962 RepID=A0A5J5GMR9_9RHOB|nr:oligosaccharide flippase family protein [Histidinibacterium aquaticum]KAA9009430.1 oligosaccharide flippase family protein [Histidinibacterium aquaticum]